MKHAALCFALLISPLGDVKQLRQQVAAHYEGAAAEAENRGLIQPERFEEMATGVDKLLKAITRKTSPLHARMLHACGLWVLREADTSIASAERLETDLRVLNEVVRVTRKLHLTIAPG